MATEENTYFLRSFLLLVEGGLYISRETLGRECQKAGGNLDALLKQCENKLKHEFHGKQYDKLFPQYGTTDINKWDLQLSVGVLINVFGRSLSLTEKRKLRALRDLRNEIYMHCASASLDQKKYEEVQEELEDIITTLAATFDKPVRDRCSAYITQFATGPLDGVKPSLATLNGFSQTCQKKLKVGLHTELVVGGPSDYWINLCEHTLDTILNNAESMAREGAGFEEIENNVKQMLDFLLANKNVVFKGSKKACIILMFECNSYDDALLFLQTLDSQEFRDHLSRISDALMRHYQFDATISISARVRTECLQSILIDILKMYRSEEIAHRQLEISSENETDDKGDHAKLMRGSEEEDSQKAESKQPLKLDLECTSKSGLLHFLNSFKKDDFSGHLKSVADALSKHFGKTITLKASLDIDDVMAAIEEAVSRDSTRCMTLQHGSEAIDLHEEELESDSFSEKTGMLTEENTYFLRAFLLLVEGGGYISTEILDRERQNEGGDFDDLLRNFERKLRHEFHGKQYEKLFPAAGNTNTETWDLQLKIGVMLHIFRHTLSPTEKQKLRTLRELRKDIFMHCVSASLDHEKYEEVQEQLEDAIETLASTFADSVKNCCSAYIRQCTEESLDNLRPSIATLNGLTPASVRAVHVPLDVELRVVCLSEELADLSYTALNTIFNLAASNTDEETDSKELGENVRKLLDFLESHKDVVFKGSNIACIILKFECRSYAGMLCLLHKLQSPEFRVHLNDIADVLMRLYQHDFPINISSKVTTECLQSVLIDIIMSKGCKQEAFLHQNREESGQVHEQDQLSTYEDFKIPFSVGNTSPLLPHSGTVDKTASTSANCKNDATNVVKGNRITQVKKPYSKLSPGTARKRSSARTQAEQKRQGMKVGKQQMDRGIPTVQNAQFLSESDEESIDRKILRRRVSFIKYFAAIKDELSQTVALSIAKQLFPGDHTRISAIESTNRRRSAVELLLKEVVSGPDEMLEDFISLLRGTEEGKFFVETIEAWHVTDFDVNAFDIENVNSGSIVITLKPDDPEAWLSMEESCRTGKIKDFIPELFDHEEIYDQLPEGQVILQLSIYSEQTEETKRAIFVLHDSEEQEFTGKTKYAGIEDQGNPIDDCLCEELDIEHINDLLKELKGKKLVDDRFMQEITEFNMRTEKAKHLVKKIYSLGVNGIDILKNYLKDKKEYLYQKLREAETFAGDGMEDISTGSGERQSRGRNRYSAKRKIFFTCTVILQIKKNERVTRAHGRRIEITCPKTSDRVCHFEKKGETNYPAASKEASPALQVEKSSLAQNESEEENELELSQMWKYEESRLSQGEHGNIIQETEEEKTREKRKTSSHRGSPQKRMFTSVNKGIKKDVKKYY